MKLSVSWIFDHLDADWSCVDSAALVNRFNCSTAEIERVHQVTLNLAGLVFGQVISVADQQVELECIDSKKRYVLPTRTGIAVGQWYLVRVGERATWSTVIDLGGTKDQILPPLYVGAGVRAADWRTYLEPRDVIIEIDNKSITNRPDLWGHRGIARELSVLLDVPLKPIENYVATLAIHEASDHTVVNGFTIANRAPNACKRFAALSFESAGHCASLLWMVQRLARIDARPIDFLVDTTNYVMLDLGQPMHAFDADKFTNKTLMATYAQEGKQLTLLDGHTITLSSQDLVISDGVRPVALAGIMGGQGTAIAATTHKVILESACFDATVIRQTAVRHRKRTDASARFEKNLDPNQNVLALQRFVHIVQSAGMPFSGVSAIASLGPRMRESEIRITHDFIEKKLGVKIESSFIKETLTRLGFVCQEESPAHYVVHVPTFRATKDITIAEDIVEEIARLWGYNHIEPLLPVQRVKPSVTQPLMRLRTIKQIFAYRCAMMELSCYPFFDESFLHTLAWQPSDAVKVQNPVSENWRHLVTTLVPMLCKAIYENYDARDTMRFFQVGRTWMMREGTINEQTMVAGVFFDKQRPIDFYTIKQELTGLFDALGVQPTWRKHQGNLPAWYVAHQTAVLEIAGVEIGYVGTADATFLSRSAPGYACIFEFNSDVLTRYNPPIKRYVPLVKYPAVKRDISILLPLRYTVDQVQHLIERAHTNITHVSLVDFFEKPEWQDQRSLTFHFVVQDRHKTLTKQEIDAICTLVAHELHTHFNAIVR